MWGWQAVAQRYAGALALIAFAAVCVQGVVTGQAFATVLARALVGLAAFAVLGYLVGGLARRAVEESVKAETDQREQAAAEPHAADTE